MLSDLSPAAIGLIGAGIAGTVAIIVQKQKSADERKAQLREKLEALILAIFEHDRLLDAQREALLLDAPPADKGVQPIARAQMLAAIYAPELLQEVNSFEKRCIAYSGYLIQKAIEKAQNPKADLVGDYPGAYNPYLEARIAVVSAAQAHIAKLRQDNKL